MVLQFVRNLHFSSGRISARIYTRIDSLLNSMRANTFPGMERSEIPQDLLQFCLSFFLKIVTRRESFQTVGTFKFYQASFVLMQSSSSLHPPLLITSGCYSSLIGDFQSRSIEITLVTSSRSGHLHIQCWVELYSMLPTVFYSKLNGSWRSVVKWPFTEIIICRWELAVVLSDSRLSPTQFSCFVKNLWAIRVCKCLQFSCFCQLQFIFEFWASLSEKVTERL